MLQRFDLPRLRESNRCDVIMQPSSVLDATRQWRYPDCGTYWGMHC